jgi:hypothetical protein
MVITIGPELEAALIDRARRQGVAPEVLALNALRNQFLEPTAAQPQDDWERRLRAVATDCGVALSDAALGREGLYD